MRNNSTPTEEIVWNFLNKNFPKYIFLRQKPLGNFIVDFYCSKLKLIIEVDGEIHFQNLARDKERDDWFWQNYKIRTFRIKNHQVEAGDFGELIKILKSTPDPSFE